MKITTSWACRLSRLVVKRSGRVVFCWSCETAVPESSGNFRIARRALAWRRRLKAGGSRAQQNWRLTAVEGGGEL